MSKGQPAMHAERSVMFMPVNNQKFINGLWNRNCDAVVFDLEDAVAEPDKVRARTLVRAAYAQAQRGGVRVHVRINHDYWYADLDAIVWPGLNVAVLPKVESATEIRRAAERISVLERKRNIAVGSIDIYAYLETMRGIANAHAIAAASPRVKALLAAGSLGFDHCRDLAIESLPGAHRPLAEYGGGCALLACAAAGVPLPRSIRQGAGAAGDVVGADRAAQEADINRRAGYFSTGISVLHPNRVEPMNKGFTPTADEVAEARAVIAKFEELSKSGEVEGELNGRVVDCYGAARARALLAWSEACARREAEKAAAREHSEAAQDGATLASNDKATLASRGKP